MVRRKGKAERKLEALSLYQSGLGLKEVAETLSVGLRTLSRWRTEDRKAGRDWDALKAEAGTWAPQALLFKLRERIGRLLEDSDRDVVVLADTLSKLTSAAERLEAMVGSPDVILRGVKEFSAWVAQNADGAEREVYNGLAIRFLEDLPSRFGAET